MSAVLDFLEDVANVVVEAIEDLVEVAWDAIVEPILGAVFAIFGITDETIVTVQRVSSPIYNTNTVDVVKAGITRAILTKIKFDTAFHPNYMVEIFKTKGQIRAYFRYADLNLYYAGLPDMQIKGVAADFDAIQIALDNTFGSTHTVISAYSRDPNKYDYFKWEMQDSPDFYKPWLNSLTNTDIYGATWDDWQLGVIDYNSGPDNYTVNISRQAEEAQFWITGPSQVTEGDTATFVVHSNRAVPLGESVDINFVYAGTAVDPTDYTEITQVTMLAGETTVDVDIVTIESVNANTDFTITIDSIDNTNAAFEMVTIHAEDFVNCIITDDDTLKLTMNDQAVDEANVTISVDVKLELVAPSGAFDVDYNFTDLGSITGGVDYDNTTGTLNFAGTVGEVQTIMVDIYADVADDDREQFEIFLENSTDVDSIDISAVSTITIYDGTSDPPPVVAPLNDTITKASYTAADSLIVTYSDDSDPIGQFWYWIYDLSDMTYNLRPEQRVLTGLEMLPMAILRKEKMQLDDLYGPLSTEFLTTKLLMARASLKLQEFLDAIGDNPDVDDIDDAYLNYALQPLDVNPIVSKMLYLAWHQIVVTSGLQSNIGQFSATISEGDIQNAIVWSQHTFIEDIVGVVADEGDYIHTVSGTDLIMQYQKTATEYDEIKLFTLNGMTAINYGSYHEVALCQLGDDEFTIPVSWEIFSEVSAQEQMEVYQFMCRVDINAINITHLEWYETEAFWDLFEFALIVISVVITVWTFGAGVIANGFTAGLLALIQAFVISYAIGELIIYVAEATGNNILAAVVGVAAAIYLNDASMLSSDQLMQADTLLDLSTEFSNNLMLLESEDLNELGKELQETAAEAQKKLEEEKANRPDIEAVAVDSQFLAALQSVDTGAFPAVQGNYAYDETYNYDSLVGNYHNQQLQIGIR
jgi:hypothetical protein